MSTKKKQKGIDQQISAEVERAVDEIERLQRLNKTYVVLSISHDVLKPVEIGKILQLQATNSLQKGDQIYKSERHDVSSPLSIWRLSSEDSLTSQDVEVHLDWLLDCLSGKLHAIRHLQSKNAKMAITIRMMPWTRLVAPSLSVHTLQKIAELKIDMDFIIHYQNTDSEY